MKTKNPVKLSLKEQKLAEYLIKQYPKVVQWFFCEGYTTILEMKIEKHNEVLPQHYKDKLKESFASVRDTGESIQGTNLHEKLQ